MTRTAATKTAGRHALGPTTYACGACGLVEPIAAPALPDLASARGALEGELASERMAPALGAIVARKDGLR